MVLKYTKLLRSMHEVVLSIEIVFSYMYNILSVRLFVGGRIFLPGMCSYKISRWDVGFNLIWYFRANSLLRLKFSVVDWCAFIHRVWQEHNKRTPMLHLVISKRLVRLFGLRLLFFVLSGLRLFLWGPKWPTLYESFSFELCVSVVLLFHWFLSVIVLCDNLFVS